MTAGHAVGYDERDFPMATYPSLEENSLVFRLVVYYVMMLN